MCGIAGLLGPGASNPEVVARMTGRLEHRGPDDAGHWADPDAGIAFGHRRLAVVDLTVAGHEPMISASGRLVVTYNGEIYNHAELRAQLEGVFSAKLNRFIEKPSNCHIVDINGEKK